jgi:hypothetical protein
MRPPSFLAFLDELKLRGYDVSTWFYEQCDKPTLRLAAKNPLVGPLVLYDDGDELSLAVGTKYHLHFSDQEFDNDSSYRMHTASELAAEFSDEVLNDRIGVAVHYDDRGCLGASLIYLDSHGLTPETFKCSSIGIEGGLIRTERFLWSGPVSNPT